MVKKIFSHLVLILFLVIIPRLCFCQLSHDYKQLINSVGIDSSLALFMEDDYSGIRIGVFPQKKIEKCELMLSTLDDFDKRLESMEIKNRPDSFMIRKYGFYAISIIKDMKKFIKDMRCDIVNEYLKNIIMEKRKYLGFDYYNIENQCANHEVLNKIYFGLSLYFQMTGSIQQACVYSKKSCLGGFSTGCDMYSRINCE